MPPASRPPRVPPPVEPVTTDDRLAVLSGMGLWALALVIAVLRRDALAGQGRSWWLWACAAGIGLGVAAVIYLHKQGRWGAVIQRARPSSRR
ncbi:MAG: DUF2530 domain-containing protein [Micrococcales bacterium]|nr:MAG: DUF2530 domain-containing protein [Micrococcales bacterium]